MKVRLTKESEATLKNLAIAKGVSAHELLRQIMARIGPNPKWRPSDSPSPAGAVVLKFEPVPDDQP